MQTATSICQDTKTLMESLIKIRKTNDRGLALGGGGVTGMANCLSTQGARQAKVTLETTSGVIDVATALRVKYENEGTEIKAQRTQSRLARWQARDILNAQGAPRFTPLDVVVKGNQFWLVAAAPNVIWLAQIVGVYKTYKNGFKPFSELALQDCERVGLRILLPNSVGPLDANVIFKQGAVTMCKCVQQLIYQLPAEFVKFEEEKRGFSLSASGIVAMSLYSTILATYWARVLS
ncbi:hypothetical protein CYMTET_11007 [Cymbomonas tetramitiformis]|uniref:Uncharacterized protein n=1 Tax=Cymbomonas tetramitiformis TaxID=36881 RepID=A0AAE0GN14_9CHLO|nr:hypothetical protein CYMTET_11007 [Cymbomonas tetramitiformis]